MCFWTLLCGTDFLCVELSTLLCVKKRHPTKHDKSEYKLYNLLKSIDSADNVIIEQVKTNDLQDRILIIKNTDGVQIFTLLRGQIEVSGHFTARLFNMAGEVWNILFYYKTIPYRYTV